MSGLRISSAKSGIKSGAQSAAGFAQSSHENHPMATGAVGLAIGAIMGSLLPLSEKEKSQLQGVADKVAESGAELASQAAGHIESAAELADPEKSSSAAT